MADIPKPTWRFPANDADEIQGANDPGITHFAGNREENVIREVIQNSLDARDDPNRPVKVAFDHYPVPTERFDSDELAAALEAAAASPDNEDETKALFSKGAKSLRKIGAGSAPCLRIVDSNTLGASDDPRGSGARSKWEALTKGEGYNAKDERDAAGSFGLGKFAAFAATDLRTVLYSVAYISSGGELRRRFQGKTILVSHTRDGKPYRKVGYFGADNFMPMKDADVPRQFALEEPGTALYILGYERKERWRRDSVTTALKHFFHAVVHGKLDVDIDGLAVNAKTIANFMNSLDRKTANFVRVSQLQPYATTDIPDIGRVVLRIQKYDDSREREIALVRDAGMMITDQTSRMGAPGLSRLPAHWKGFTAVVECLSEGKPSLLRDAESPRHDEISRGYITDPKRRREARDRLRELTQWCREQIESVVQSNLAGRDSVTEIARYLPIDDDDGEQNAARERGKTPAITVLPYQSNRAPSRIRAAIAGGGGGKTQGPGESDDEPFHPDGPPKDKPKDKPKTPRTGGVVSEPTGFEKQRFLGVGRNPTHSIVAAFDNPNQPLANVQLTAIGEDGASAQLGIREAYADGARLAVSGDAVELLDGGDAARWKIEFVTREPVANKTFRLTIKAQQDEV